MKWHQYYGRWFSVAFWHAWSGYEFAVSAFGLILPLLQKLRPSLDQPTMADLAWQMTACGLGTLFLVRLILAPWWMHKEQESKLTEAKRQLTEKANELSEKDREIVQERTVLLTQLDRARTSDPRKNAIRHGIELWISRFEAMKSRVSHNAILAGEFYPVEIEADRYLRRLFPEYEHFSDDYALVGSQGAQQMIGPDEATKRCEARLKRLREALSMLS